MTAAQPSFSLVPVIDLRGGVVVRARAGERHLYAPIVTPLSASPDPVEIVNGLLNAIPASRVYVADLDAIMGSGDNVPAIRRIRRGWPELELWVDAGFATPNAARRFLDLDLGRVVLGTESQTGPELVSTLGDDSVLSLDTSGEERLGPEALHADPSLWPSRVIAMTLARVGTGAGPDLERLADLRRRKPSAAIYAAGGVRGPEDIAGLLELGVAGALVASVLHDGRLTRDDLARLGL